MKGVEWWDACRIQQMTETKCNGRDITRDIMGSKRRCREVMQALPCPVFYVHINIIPISMQVKIFFFTQICYMSIQECIVRSLHENIINWFIEKFHWTWVQRKFLFEFNVSLKCLVPNFADSHNPSTTSSNYNHNSIN